MDNRKNANIQIHIYIYIYIYIWKETRAEVAQKSKYVTFSLEFCLLILVQRILKRAQ